MWVHTLVNDVKYLQSQFPTRLEEMLYSSRDRRNEVWDQNREEFESNVSYPSSDCVPRTTWWNPIANPIRYDEKSDVRPVRSERNRNTKGEAAPETRLCTLPVLCICFFCFCLRVWASPTTGYVHWNSSEVQKWEYHLQNFRQSNDLRVFDTARSYRQTIFEARFEVEEVSESQQMLRQHWRCKHWVLWRNSKSESDSVRWTQRCKVPMFEREARV